MNLEPKGYVAIECCYTNNWVADYHEKGYIELTCRICEKVKRYKIEMQDSSDTYTEKHLKEGD